MCFISVKSYVRELVISRYVQVVLKIIQWHISRISIISSVENVFSIGFGSRPISLRMFKIMRQKINYY